MLGAVHGLAVDSEKLAVSDSALSEGLVRFERDRAFAAAAAAVAEPHTQLVLLRRFVNAESPDASLVRLGGFGAAAA